MTFGYDICTYLLGYHRELDKTVVPNGFALDVKRLNIPEPEESSTLVKSIPTLRDGTVVVSGFRHEISRMDILDQFKNEAGDIVVSQDVLYLNQVPSDKTDCVCVFDTGGYSSDHSYRSCSVIDKPTAQIRVRNKSLQVAEKTAYAIFVLLDELCYESINEHYYLQISVNNPPTFLSKDQITTNATAYEFTLNLNSMTKRR